MKKHFLYFFKTYHFTVTFPVCTFYRSLLHRAFMIVIKQHCSYVYFLNKLYMLAKSIVYYLNNSVPGQQHNCSFTAFPGTYYIEYILYSKLPYSVYSFRIGQLHSIHICITKKQLRCNRTRGFTRVCFFSILRGIARTLPPNIVENRSQFITPHNIKFALRSQFSERATYNWGVTDSIL